METVAVFDFVIGLDDKESPLYLANYYKLVLYEKGLSIFPDFQNCEHIRSIVSVLDSFAVMVDAFTFAWGESTSPRELLRKMKSAGYIKKFREFVVDDGGKYWVPKNEEPGWETKV
jgi:hypothetical protein